MFESVELHRAARVVLNRDHPIDVWIVFQCRVIKTLRDIFGKPTQSNSRLK